MKTRTIHVVGTINSGKTTLVVELVTALVQQGLRVATIKHTHHDHELDVPGKDSHRHREAGAEAVGIMAPGMAAVFSEQDPEQDVTDRLQALVDRMPPCDLIVVEGGQFIRGDKIEVWRREAAESPLAQNDKSIHALISCDKVSEFVRPIWQRDYLNAIVDGVPAIAGIERRVD